MSKLTAKQDQFVREYLKDLNATQAAIRAGYSERTAAEIGNENLRKPQIRQAIDSAMAERSERVQVDADYVLERLKQIDQLDIADLIDNAGSIKPVLQWPKTWRTTISGLDLHEMMTGDVETIVRKIKWPDKVKNLELLGKHVGVQAFKDTVDHNIKSVRLIDLTGKD